MAGPKQVDKATKGLNALVDEFTSAVKELVNAGEETAVHLAVGGGRAISAIIDATGEVTKVTVETAENRMDDVETYVRGDTLVIDMSSSGRRNYWRNVDVDVVIAIKSLEGIEVMGAVEADIKGVDSERLEIEIKGAADLNIEGKCGELDLDVRGAGDISASDLKCESVEVDVAGAGNASVYATDKVDADVAGVASIQVYGKPKTVRKHVGGLGSISIR